MIEQTLERIAAALEVIAAQGPALNVSATPAAAPLQAEPKKRGRPALAPVAPAATPAPAAATADGDEDVFGLDAPAAPTKKLTREDVRAALIAYQKRVNSQDKARALLKKVGGVDTLPALSEEKFAAVIAATHE